MTKARNIVISIVVCFTLLQALKYCVAQTFHVVSNAMSPTLQGRDSGHCGDYIVVEKIAYRFREPQKGEIVLFNTKGLSNPSLNPNVHYLRRIAGVPGETVIIKNEKKQLSDNEFLISGDSPENGIEIGPISRDNIMGRAICIYFPFDRLGKIEASRSDLHIQQMK